MDTLKARHRENKQHPLFFVFFLHACFGPLLYAADLSSKGQDVPLGLYIIAEVVVLSLALFFGLRRQRK
ncbi:MAG: hypothetical protein WA860_10195 [Acidimicrobiales bacterium]